MLNKVIFDAPINNLSFGNVSMNFFRELIKRDAVSAFFPVGDQADFTAFDNLNPETRDKIIELGKNRLLTFNQNTPSLKLWHINGSEKRISRNQFLYTFYELDEPTKEEINIVQNQNHVFLSSSESTKIFKNKGCKNVSYVPIGFDPDIKKDDRKTLFDENVIHFGLIGKLEKRKNTQRIIQTWLKKYGNNKEFQLTCLVNNPFFNPEVYNNIIRQTLGDKHWSNINFLSSLRTNSEVNQVYNAIDIDLSGCSSAEGWGLPAFNTACLGKIGVVANCSAHKDWAQGDNIILIKPQGKIEAYDGAFFQKGASFNQGFVYNISEDAIADGMDRAVNLFKSGYKDEVRTDLIEKFSYSKTIDAILDRIFNCE